MNHEQEKVVRKITGLLRQAVAPWCIKCRRRLRANGRGWYCNNLECFPANPEAPWCLSCQVEMGAYGYSRNRAHRWMCFNCRRTLSSTYLNYFDRNWTKREIRKPEQYKRVVSLCHEGHSVRTIARLTGLSKLTVAHYRDVGVKEGAQCACGRPAKHQGWCWWRYQHSPKRQEFMQRWHSKDV